MKLRKLYHKIYLQYLKNKLNLIIRPRLPSTRYTGARLLVTRGVPV